MDRFSLSMHDHGKHLIIKSVEGMVGSRGYRGRASCFANFTLMRFCSAPEGDEGVKGLRDLVITKHEWEQ